MWRDFILMSENERKVQKKEKRTKEEQKNKRTKEQNKTTQNKTKQKNKRTKKEEQKKEKRKKSTKVHEICGGLHKVDFNDATEYMHSRRHDGKRSICAVAPSIKLEERYLL